MAKIASLHLKVLIPSKIFLEEGDIKYCIVDTSEGSYGILPNRLDFAAILVPGIMIYKKRDREEEYVAHDKGVIVKTGGEIFISTHQAVKEAELGKLKNILLETTAQLNQKEQHIRNVIEKLEGDITSHLIGV